LLSIFFVAPVLTDGNVKAQAAAKRGGGVANRPWSSSNDFGAGGVGLWAIAKNNRPIGGQVAHDLFSTVARLHAAPGARCFLCWVVPLGTCRARTDCPFEAAASEDALVKKHSSAEIIEKLARADQLATQGLSQNAICGELGISVMTLHRWRARGCSSHDAQLEQRLLLENRRLRDVAANLLLEIRTLEETRAKPGSPPQKRLGLADKDLEPARPRAQALAPEA
jgi:hypothetical protein